MSTIKQKTADLSTGGFSIIGFSVEEQVDQQQDGQGHAQQPQ
jgi:hypothetical protein